MSDNYLLDVFRHLIGWKNESFIHHVKKSDGGIVDTITNNRNAVKEPTLSHPIGNVYINGKVATEKQIKSFNMYDFDSFHMSINTEKE